nr:hypothetical protein Iba_chr02eCG1600 [Ipomoea batatas]GME08232.1 hypothetical protein Iba_scaffold7383CG0020 [Ipomoea batatas]
MMKNIIPLFSGFCFGDDKWCSVKDWGWALDRDTAAIITSRFGYISHSACLFCIWQFVMRI